MSKTVQRGTGAITLGDLAGRLEVLRVVCSKCGRAGQYGVARLIERHGPGVGLPEFKDQITADCPVRARRTWEPCQAHFPDLVEVM